MKNNPDRINYLLLALVLASLFLINGHKADFGDYALQIAALRENGSLLVNGYLLNRYPPATSVVYQALLSLLFFLPVKSAILAIHGGFMVGIQYFFNRMLEDFNYNKAQRAGKYALRSLAVLNPVVIYLAWNGVNSELPFMLFSMAALLFLVRFVQGQKWYYLAATGFFLALSLLTRMQALPLIVASLVLLLILTREWKPLLLLMVLVSVLVGPWQALCSRYTGSFISSGAIPSMRDGLLFNNHSSRETMWLPADVEALSDTFSKRYYHLESVHFTPDYNEPAFVFHYLRERPVVALKLAAFKFIRCFYGLDSQNQKMEGLIRWLVTPFLLLFAWSVFVLVRNQRRKFSPFVTWFLIYAAGTVAMSMAVLSIVRYQVILWPFMLFFILMAYDANLRLLLVKNDTMI